MFDIEKDVCWVWRNPNPQSKLVHRVSIWANGLGSCVGGIYLYSQALAGKVRVGEAREVTCRVCARKSIKKPLMRMQLLAALNRVEKLPGLSDFRQTLAQCDDSPDTARETGIVLADWLEERGQPLAALFRLISCESSEWSLIGELRPALARQIEKRAHRAQREQERITAEADSVARGRVPETRWLFYSEPQE